ncbi:conserved Plasmodium protein, unknown function [Plasmodium knowlesi strain H]|uniref:Mitochondrial distribution and morphology protein 35 n=4 Tax=Plasmodium TaxID=5820 RepID=A0A5K1V600_PLAKH|nr:conserved protein, unknown function [Plasmodium knowlesi strain H]XP_019912668.1 Uncharacterized protein PCOAH_00003840 [Plasmodium coatneyi]OTN66349.1 Uncharacterized protein PKNOH_S09510900 [Plasmodium knowlesi]ANQ05973.1 Uncharacterized protein PCOAH_00003840 [Plasmodium coatneyi]CAA9986282.1 conserved protein, unknown function [Plasmodium knowlesi strain H]SBO25500.1 conserved Plasmodium protein, unknown function [Plasmodium knowlesi strain H]SBO28268.1 conserved Plasmodium protein, un|eukprot:XP_002257688.1 hypothetical protein, conserved in Plasmodium species [Plasmodium knowlesi strain H]
MDNTKETRANTVKAHLEAIDQCKEKKEKYVKCFNNWYKNNFLKGDLTQACDDYYEDYQICVLNDLNKKGLGHLANLPKGK